MSYATTVIENQHKLYSLGEQEGYRKIMQIKNSGKVISNYDLTPSTTNNSIPNEFFVPYVYCRDFISVAGLSSMDISFIVEGMIAGRTAIVVQGGSIDCLYQEDKGVIADYNYTNNGNEEFNEENCIYGQISTEKVIELNGVKAGFACKPFRGSDNKYITGSIVRNDIKPIGGRNEWSEVPIELEECEYIVFQGLDYTSTENQISFTVNIHNYIENRGVVRIYMLCISPLIFDTEWTRMEGLSAKTRYQNYIDDLSVAYMIQNGYAAQSDIITTGGKHRCRRWDALYHLFEDCGNKRGFNINPTRLSNTGFDETSTTYSYTDYLNAWIPYPCDTQFVYNKILE